MEGWMEGNRREGMGWDGLGWGGCQDNCHDVPRNVLGKAEAGSDG